MFIPIRFKTIHVIKSKRRLSIWRGLSLVYRNFKLLFTYSLLASEPAWYVDESETQIVRDVSLVQEGELGMKFIETPADSVGSLEITNNV